ncbi:TonB-dependent receptor [Sphingomonas sp. VNH70]|uniref:TonB-dependent receptor n=1 Tax=Sphingomonas silueang TaxID=3156617 RepID=UPI0032B483F1
MVQFRKMLLWSGSVFVLATATGAFAQDTAPQPAPADQVGDEAAVEEIIVRGTRAATRDALNVKESADFILDALSAEDIGDLPDLNAGDALIRLPGVSGGGGTGEPESLSVRGFSSEYGLTTLNGRVLTSDRSGRNVRTNLFPSALLGRVAIYKTPTAKMVEGGVSGTVELSTADPLSSLKRSKIDTIVRLTGRYQYDDSVEGITRFNPQGYRVDGSIRQALFGRKLGIGIGFSHQVLPGTQTAISAQRPVLDGALIRPGYTPITGPTGQLIFDDDANTRTPDPFEDNEALIAPTGLSYLIEAFETKRTAGTLLMTYEPSDNLSIKFDGLAARETNYFEQARLYNSFFGDGISGTVDSTGFIQNVLFNNVQVDSLPRERNEETDTLTAGLNAKWSSGDWTISPDLFYSNVRLDRFTAEATIRPGTQRALTYISSGNQYGAIGVDYLNFDPANPATLLFRGLALDRGARRDKSYSGRLDIRRDLDWPIVSSIEFGTRYENRRKGESFSTADYNSTAFQGRFSTATLQSLRIPFISANAFDRFDADQPIPRSWYQLSPFAVLDGPLAGVAPDRLNTAADALASSVIREETLAGYAMANLSGRLFGVRFRGNVGVRAVKTWVRTAGSTGTFRLTQSNSGVPIFAVDNNTVQPLSQQNAFTDVLPSLNLAFDLTGDLRLRLGAARSIARPPFQNLFPGRRLGVEQELDDAGLPTGPQVLTIAGGNPLLEPYRASNLDLSLEWSPNRDTLAAIAVFHKNIDSIIVGGQPLNSTIETAAGTLPLRLRTFVNEKPPESVVNGVEVQLSTTFSMLPAPLDGLGILANYSFIDSRITEVIDDSSLYTRFNADGTIAGYVFDERDPEVGTRGGVRQPLSNLSRHQLNLVLFYEKGPLGLRFAGRWRSDGYDREALAINTVRFAGRPVFDLNMRYALAKNVTFLAQARNITNEYRRSYFYEQRPIDDPVASATFVDGGNTNRMRDVIFRGRDFILGLNIGF